MITVLSGGTGTPKLLQGLKEVIDPKDITIVVNTLENEYFSLFYSSANRQNRFFFALRGGFHDCAIVSVCF